MHNKTMEIREFPDTEDGQTDANTKGFTVSLTKKQAGELAGMNRKQRRAWLSEQRQAK